MAAHSDKELTEVLYGSENIIKKTSETFSWIESTLDGCIDHTELAMHVITPVIWNGLNKLKERGVKLKLVTEITADNITYAKKIMEIAEVRHLKGVRSSFGIADGIEYLDHAISDRNELSHAIISNVKSIVGAKQYLFETLWNISRPAEQTIKEIEVGVEPTKTEIIQDTTVSISRAYDVIKSAKEQVLVIWATSKTFIIGMNSGVDKLYSDAIRNGAIVKLLIPHGDNVEAIVKDLKQIVPQIIIKTADKSLETKITILVVDRREVMTWELRDDEIQNPYEAGGLATYSNNESIASSYATIFESLWKQTELYEQSQNFNKMQNDFVNIAAHELRTPIQPIIGLTQVLRSQITDSNQQELLDVTIRNAKRLNKLSSEILDVTRLDSNNFELNKEVCNLRDIIINAIDDITLSNEFSNKKDQLQLSYEPRDILLNVDKSRIVEVLTNLLSNAVKFTSKGTITISVEQQQNDKDNATDRSNKKTVTIMVRDTGQGIDASMLPRLFTKFASKSFQGTGLGLFISKGIIEAHHGRIWGKNNDNGIGATFLFSLRAI